MRIHIHLEKITGGAAVIVALGSVSYTHLDVYKRQTMYFPLIVDEALMFEPTETESVQTLDGAIAAVKDILDRSRSDPQSVHNSPVRCV